jgi:Domain of unknown function (DUF397)
MSKVESPVALGEQVQSDGSNREEAGPGGLSEATWHKSSWSAYNGNCVEVARLRGGLIAVRDTKDAGCGPTLTFGAASWGSFLNALKNGDLPI